MSTANSVQNKYIFTNNIMDKVSSSDGGSITALELDSSFLVALGLTLRLIRYSGIDMFRYSNEEVPLVYSASRAAARFAI